MQGYESYYGHGSAKAKDVVAAEILKNLVSSAERKPSDWNREKIKEAVSVSFIFAEVFIERSRDEK